MKRFITTTMIMVLLMAIFTVSASAETVTTRLNFREGPGVAYTAIHCLPEGAVVTVLDVKDGWATVEYRGEKGYVYAQYLSDVPVTTSSHSSTKPTAITGNAYTKVRANLREGPGTDYAKLGIVPQYKEVQVISHENDWYQVVVGSKTGYIRDDLLMANKPSKQASAPIAVKGTITYTATTRVLVRTGPGSEYEELGIIRTGETVQAIGNQGNWLMISYKGQTAYTFGQYYIR